MPPEEKSPLPEDRPKKEHKVYVRRDYDPEKHCGAPVDRSLATARARIERLEGMKAEYLGKSTLTKTELSALKWLDIRLVHQSKTLARYEERERLYGPDHRPCMHKKGERTDHPGVGLCYKHCACQGKDGGHLSLYGKAKDKKLAELVEQLENSSFDVLNLEPHAKMILAKLMLFLEDKQDFGPESVKSLTLLSEQFRRTVDSITDTKFKSMISIDLFNVLQQRMSEAVAEVVKDPELLDQIAERWGRISVDSAEKKLQRMIETGRP